MRVSGLLCTAAVVVCLNPPISSAQAPAPHKAAVSAATAEEQTEPFHKHHDSRHGHDHYYPDRGAIVRDLPVGTIGTSYAGVSYRYHDGIWLEPRGPAYMVVAPPIGLLAPTLPLYSTVVTHGGDSYLYCNDTYYRPRPDLGGYEVVNDPTLESVAAVPAAPEALVGGAMPSAPAAAGGAPGSGAFGAGVVGAGAIAGGAGGSGSGMVVSPSLAATAQGPAATVVPAAAVVREASLAGGTMPGAGAPAASASLIPTASVGPAASVGAAGATTVAGTQKVPKVFLYPKSGQSADQQAHDRYDCYRFAVAQSGFDPMRTGAAAAAPSAEQQSDFDRAQGACFEGRGYSNR
jgi:Family of unknown function (DUF6515)